MKKRFSNFFYRNGFDFNPDTIVFFDEECLDLALA